MKYVITDTSVVKLNETAGTIQNCGNSAIRISNSADFTNSLLLYPQNKSTFNEEMYITAYDEDIQPIEVNVVPFFFVSSGNADAVSSEDFEEVTQDLSTAFKSAAISNNTVNFYTTTDTTGTAAFTFDFPEGIFLDQTGTELVSNFIWSGILYPNSTNPNLNGKTVLVLAVKGDKENPTVKYSFVDVSKLVDVYTPSDNTINISDNEISVKVSAVANNAIAKMSDGLHVDISGKINKVTGATGNISSFNSDGTLANTEIPATDIIVKIANATAGDLASLASDGKIADSAILADNVLVKVANATTGNLIAFSEGGSISDSGISAITIANKVDKETGKGLSTNDYTTSEKTKLSNIAEGAQVNVIESIKLNNTALAISNKSVNIDLSGYVATETSKGLSTNDYTTAEKTKLAGIAENANNYFLPDATTTNKGGVTVSDNISVSNGKISITKNNVTSALGYTPPISDTTYSVATTSANGLMSAGDKTKLDGVATGAQVNVIESVKLNGTVLTPSSKAVNIDISGKIDKVATPTAGNVPILISDGTLANSTIVGADVATKDEIQEYIREIDTGEGFIKFKNGNDEIVQEIVLENVEVSKAVRYGYKIKKSESDPYARVEYIYDAVGFTPAYMDFENDVFEYGSWADVWFVKDNKPLMLKSDGTVDYYLNPNDYSKKEDGTASDVSNTSYDGNAMAQIPLCWVKRYEDSNYIYEIVSNVKWDDDYYAYAHTNSYGEIKDYFYFSLFEGASDTSKIRSLSGFEVSKNLTPTQMVVGARANNIDNTGLKNGQGWHIHTFSQRSLINTLCVLMGKSTDTPSVFGNGNVQNSGDTDTTINTGTIYNKGQFYGSNSDTSAVKVFHIENYWGNQSDRILGIYCPGNSITLQLTPVKKSYTYSGNSITGEFSANNNLGNFPSGYIKNMKVVGGVLFPNNVSGTSTTYFCDYYNHAMTVITLGTLGGDTSEASKNVGAFRININFGQGGYWRVGCGLSYIG